MNSTPISNGLRRKIYELRAEFQQILGEAQIIIDNTGAYLVTENSVTEIDQPTDDLLVTQYDDALMLYAIDIFTALEQCDQYNELDLDGLLRTVTDISGTNGQRMNAYKKLGDYLQDALLRSNVTALKKRIT